ncbi:hypothetical protein HU200_028419 [Digitaria exilis]|uniref:Disease resistance protein At4g27190-like leucine-rich repeats domain-containing protein n=1 Tax=Digitaria exilis TaxID=1010633 RepID=A0A835BV93_9POAL|nr:hypothetical protein HU200_028419 [Digitaria exilis]
MQRRIAEELKLNHKTMAMFGEQDEEDDINGVDSASRDVIPEIATVINRTMRESRFMLFFINGSDEEIILSPFGIPEYHDSVIIWTYRRFDVANMSSGYIGSWHRNIRSNSTVLHSLWSLSDLTTSNLTALLHEEATFIDKNEDASTLACMREMDIDGFLYSLFIRAALAMTSSPLKGAKDPSSYWICDGVIQGGKAEEIINALYQKIDADYTRDARAIAYNLSSRKRTPYLIGTDDDLLRACGERPHRWIAIRLKDEIASKNKKALEDMQSALTTATSIILRYDKLDKTPCGLFDVLFKQCNNVRVLILARCSFSFVSPPFQHCYKLRFLELDHCPTTIIQLNLKKRAIIQYKDPSGYARSFVVGSGTRYIYSAYLYINITSSAAYGWPLQPEATRKELTEYKDQQHCIVPDLYSDVFKDDKLGDGPLISTQAFPQPPCVQLARHIEIGDGSRNVQIEVEANDCSLGDLMTERAESLHVHDAMARAATPRGNWSKLRWCWVERCPNLYVVFPSGASEDNKLETIWVSDLLKARCIWCKGRSPLWGEVRRIPYAYFSVQHLHLRSCPSIEYAVPLWSPSFPSLETLHIINCGGLKHVFEQDNEEHLGSVKFPTLTTIHLHDLPTLRQICKGAVTLAPALESGDHQDQGMLEHTPAAGTEGPQGWQEEAGRGGGEGRVGRAGVGWRGRRTPPFPLRGARALALLQTGAPAQGHRPQVKIHNHTAAGPACASSAAATVLLFLRCLSSVSWKIYAATVDLISFLLVLAIKRHDKTDISGAREEIFNIIQRDMEYNNNINIYFDGCLGFGAATVLRSIAQVLPSMKDPPPELCFGRVIYIDCSSWTSMRAMQKVIAQQLRIENETMAIFANRDEEDDFNGVDLGSREAIRSVAAVIDRNLRESRFMMIFINGSEEEISLGRLGIPENSDYVILWTFSARLVTMYTREDRDEIAKKLRYTDVFLQQSETFLSLNPKFTIAIFREEAANILARYSCMRGMGLTRVVDCCLYGLLLTYHTSCSTTGFAWSAHAPNFWICDGIIPRDISWEISNVLHSEISFKCNANVLDDVLGMLNIYPTTPFLLLQSMFRNVYEERPCRWLSVTYRSQEEVETTWAGASSIFLAFENKHGPVGLPNGYFKHCTNLGVLVLSCCAFSFMSPPFLQCYTLRFLGLDHCTDDNTLMKLEGGQDSATRWAFVKSLWVIDLHYTDWVEILSEENIKLMSNLMEVNIEGVRWPRWKSSHQMHYKRLSNLQHLRIIKPKYDEATVETASSDISDSFLLMDNTSLEILDLSGSNKVMGSISSKAGHLRMIVLDGCDGLGDVMLSNNSSLRSFSFDGYGPAAASHRTTTVELPVEMSRPKQPPTNANKKDAIKTSIISLQGCGRLDKLFLRGLPNLVELDLSGCAIKVLDFGSMVVDVPMLKRLFLIGCEHLCAIKWYSNGELVARKMQMICIDTRPGSRRVLGCAWPTSLGAQQKSFGLQVHAIITNARLARSLYYPISTGGSSFGNSCCFNIRITSSAALSTNNGAVIKPVETMSKDMRMVRSSSKQHRQHNSMEEGLVIYGDIIGDGLAPMQAFPQTPMAQSDHHIEIVGGDGSLQSEAEDSYAHNLASLMSYYTKSIHVHDVSTCSNTMAANYWYLLRSCHVERCPSLHAVFPPGGVNASLLQTIWASNLLNTRCVWSKGGVTYDQHLQGLRHLHLHLHCCPNLWFALVMSWHRRPSFPSLETLHIIHCGDLRHVFVPDDEELQHKSSVQFPELTTIHLYDLSALQQICEGAETVAPMLETIKIRGCPNLRRLPALRGREAGMKLEWDGVDAGNHPSLCKTPVHSRFYKRRMLRRTVLR